MSSDRSVRCHYISFLDVCDGDRSTVPLLDVVTVDCLIGSLLVNKAAEYLKIMVYPSEDLRATVSLACEASGAP
nr:hypothetical protein CFP56_73755 [Quercus suber]